jgi:hypothetical protein
MGVLGSWSDVFAKRRRRLMADPCELPVDFPAKSVAVMLDFVRGRQSWDREVLSAVWTLVGYGASLGVPPKVVGQVASGVPGMDPGPLETKVAEALEQALSQHEQPEARMGLIPWVLIVDFAIQVLLKRVFS